VKLSDKPLQEVEVVLAELRVTTADTAVDEIPATAAVLLVLVAASVAPDAVPVNTKIPVWEGEAPTIVFASTVAARTREPVGAVSTLAATVIVSLSDRAAANEAPTDTDVT
jgi:hypothetical protein